MNVRTLPATLSVAFVLASLYQFGGITTVELPWSSSTLITQHGPMVSLGAFAAALRPRGSSITRPGSRSRSIQVVPKSSETRSTWTGVSADRTDLFRVDLEMI